MAKLGKWSSLTKCSFCGKAQDQVAKLVAGQGVYICNECVGLCNDIMGIEAGGVLPPDSARPSGPPVVAGARRKVLSNDQAADRASTQAPRLVLASGLCLTAPGPAWLLQSIPKSW